MIIEIIDKSVLEKEIIFKLPKIELNFAKEKKISDLAKSLNLKGFRKGFIPYNIIISRFGNQIDNDVLNDLLYKNLLDFLNKKDVNYIKFPFLKTSDLSSSDEYLIFYFDFEVYPVINFNFEECNVIKYLSFVNENDVDNEIFRLRNLYGEWKNVEVVSLNDKISFSIFNNEDKSCVFFDDDVLVNSDYEKISDFLSFVIDKVIDVNYDISSNYLIDLYKFGNNKSLIFNIRSIKRFFLSEIDDIFYEKINFNKSLDFRSFIRSKLNDLLSKMTSRLLRKDFFSSLVNAHNFDIPVVLINEKLTAFKEKGIYKLEHEVINDVKLDLLLKEFIKKFNIFVTKDEVLNFFNNKYNGSADLNDSIYFYIENEIYLEKIFDIIITKVNFEEKNISFSELLKLGKSI